MVDTSDGLSKHIAHLEHFQLGASRLVIGLVDRVGHDNPVERTSIDAVDGVAAQDAVRDERVDLSCTFFLQQFRCAGDGVGGVGKIVHENGSAVRDVSDQHHGRVLSVVDLRRSTFLVDESEGHAERICDSGCALRTTGIWADYHGLLEVGDVELDVFAEEMTTVQVVHGDIEEPLVLRVCSSLASLCLHARYPAYHEGP